MTEPYSLAAQKSGLGYRILRAIKRDKLLFFDVLAHICILHHF